ncbi:MAG: DUF456 domain-containing protein [Planctomycetota bacterium]
MSDWFYFLMAALLLATSLAAWLSNLVGLPGNWLVVGGAALLAWGGPSASGLGIGWPLVIGLAAIAGAGELAELAAGAMGAAKQGASRRAVLLAAIGAMVGGIAGAIIGVPVPIVGPLVAALGGSALGSFAGAYLGQRWSRRTEAESFAAGHGALIGRLWGAASKLLAGLVMIVALTVGLFW